MVTTQNIRMPGVVFYHGMDATADMLNASQQFLSTEISERTKDLLKWPGYSWGLRIGLITGQSVTITQGVAIDKFGSRLVLPKDSSYGVKPPAQGHVSFYLCVRGVPVTAKSKIHPYDGTQQPIEQVVGLQFFTDMNTSYDYYGNAYSSDGTGLLIARIVVAGAGYAFDDHSAGTRSPLLKMRDGV